MAMATFRAPSLKPSLPPFQSPISSNYPKPFCVSFRGQRNGAKHSPALSSLRFSRSPSLRFVPFASSGETETTETEEVQVPQVEDLLDGTVVAEDVTSDDSESDTSDDVEDEPEEKPVSAVVASLQSYKEALASNDESKIAEIESFLKSLEDEKLGLERKLASLSEEMSIEKDRILRISADFDNFRKRTERERNSLVTNAQGEVVESLLPVLDNFERAKVQIKVETEGEEKINNSYQSIYKQFIEILTSLGVVPVETVGNPFDPLLHEAIMQEDSEEFEEGVIFQEFRRGFKLGDRLLRPSMVKVSAGPGPAKPEQVVPEEEQDVSDTNGTKEGSSDAESA
ncbi:GrpE nucleotide exchange factor [Parasponia andersonii]|uniref:GrpE protein homolog n=1 Tax=Parasponia andersonii TaxID=3476 RepID=A0A2P5CZ16_PARAD|nr:GrpE nucleotide exchange factor [Parasponia andersonii]